MSEDKRIKFLNNHLKNYGKVISSLFDVNSSILINLHEKILQKLPDGLISEPKNQEDNQKNIEILLNNLSNDVLEVPLTHIIPNQVVNYDNDAILNLIDIYIRLNDYMIDSCPSTARSKSDTKLANSLSTNITRPPTMGYGQEVTCNNSNDYKYQVLRRQLDSTAYEVDHLVHLADELINPSARVTSHHGSSPASPPEQLLLPNQQQSTSVASSTCSEQHINSASTPANPQIDRAKYLHKLIKSVLKQRQQPPHHQNQAVAKSTNTNTDDNFSNFTESDSGEYINPQLREYVDDHRDVISSSNANYNKARSKFHKPDEDLTLVTAYDECLAKYDNTMTDNLEQGGAEDDEDNCATFKSTDTYIVPQPNFYGYGDEQEAEDMPLHATNCNAWAESTKALTKSAYEQQFLTLLMDEEELLNQEKNKVNAKAAKIQSGHNPKSSKPVNHKLSLPLDELIDKETTEATKSRIRDHSKQVKISSRSNGCSSVRSTASSSSSKHSARVNGSYVTPVVKHFKHPIKQINDSATSRNYKPEDVGVVSQLLDDFPGMQLSEHTMRQMWIVAARQAESIQRTQQELSQKISNNKHKIIDASQRQHHLTQLIQREALHDLRIREQREQQRTQIKLHRERQRVRAQNARAKRYADELKRSQSAIKLHKKDREEAVFRATMRQALSIQQERVREARKLAKDVTNKQLNDRAKEMEALENYYRDRFSMLADTLKNERKNLEAKDKFQDHELCRMRNEMRQKLESDIKMLQQSVADNNHEEYFRRLDADTFLQNMRQS